MRYEALKQLYFAHELFHKANYAYHFLVGLFISLWLYFTIPYNMWVDYVLTWGVFTDCTYRLCQRRFERKQLSHIETGEILRKYEREGLSYLE